MTKLTKSKSPPSSPLGRLSFFGSSSTGSLVGPSRPVIQKGPGGRWSIVRVRTPRPDVSTLASCGPNGEWEGDTDAARERREEEGRGYEGMIRPLYLGDATIGDEAHGDTVGAGQGSADAGVQGHEEYGESGPSDSAALQAAMLNPTPIPSSLPSHNTYAPCTFSYPPQALRSSTASTVSTIPPVPPIPDAYRALAPRSPTSPTSPGSPRSLSGRTWGSPGKGEGGQYPLSEYADESARDGSEEGCGAMLGRKLEYMPQDPYHGVSAKASAGIATGGEDAGGIKGGLQSAGPVRDPSGHGGSPGDAVETAVVPQPKHHQVIPPGAHAPAPARSPSFLGRGEESPLHHMLPPQDTSQPLSLGSVPPPIQARSFSPADPSAVDLERNPSSSTTGTKSTYNTARASSTDPTTTTDESAALFTPPSVVLLDAHQASGYHWSEEADVGCSTHGHNVEVHTGDDDGTAETVEGMSGEGVTFSDCGMAGVGSYHALPDLAEVALPGPPDVHSRSLSNTPSRSTLTSTSHALTSSDVRRSPTTGKLSRIDWEGDLHHRRSATTINTTTYKNTSTTDHSNNHSKDSSNTNTPTPVPLSLEDGHGERMMRSRAGSTGGQSTALSLYSIGGVLMTEPTKVVKGDNAAQGREKGRRASDASISSAVLLGPPLDQSRVKESGRARTQSMVAPPTHGKIPADYARSLDRVERDGIQVDEQQESRRPRRSSARHSYVLPTRRAPPPPIFYIEQTPPETPSSPARVLDEQQDPVADAVPSTPGRSSLVRRLMSASVLTLPAGNNASLHMTADEPTSASVRNRRRLPSTPKSSTSRGLFSASVVSLPATSGSHRPAQFWHEDEAVPHASPEQVRSPTTPGMLTRVKAMMSASVISLHQQLNPDGRSDDGDRQVGSKAGPVKGLSKRVSMGPEVVHADKRKQEQEQHQTQQKKGGFGEIWRRMSAGRKGRKARASMGAEIPDGAGRVPLNSDCAPTRASIPSQRATSASKGSLPSETAVAHISSSGASTQLKPSLGKRRPVPAYNPANCTDLLPVPANSPAFKSSREKRKSQNIDTSEARRENVSRPPSKILSVPRLSSRPAIRISTAPSPASATLPSLPSPITLANACAIPSSAVTGGKEGGRISPNRHRRRTSSNRHSRPFSMADRQKEEKRRYRRTLIEITDDELFQQVVGDLSRLDVGRPGSLDQAGPGHVRPVPLAGGDGDTKGFSSEIKPAESKPESVDGAIARPGARRTHSSTSVSVSGMASVAYDPWTAPSKTFASPAQPAAAQQLGKATLGEKTVDTTVYGVQAWFVMRELVQGERRHGRLLARGIAVSKQVASHLHTNDVESPPVASSNRNMVRPTSLVEVSSARTGDRLSALRSSTFAVFDRSWSSSAQSSTVNLALDASLVVEEGTLGTAKRCDRQGKSQDGPVDTTMRRSVSFSRITLARTMRSEPEPMLSLTPPRPSSMLVPNSTSVIVRTVREQHRQSFDILLQRLPRLLALSLTLSSRFAHDPSPDQIATAFLSMEDELTAEMAGWAADVGVLIGSGVGKEIDRLRRSGSQSSGGRPTPASPSLRSRSSFPMPSQGGNGNGRSKNTLNMNSASGLADRAALEALADSTAFMPRMGRAHSYATMPSRPPSPGNSPVVVTSHTTVGSSISSFMGLGSSSSTNTNANTGPTTRASQLSNASTVHVRGATSSNTHDDQDRTSFSDVIMAPVQRAARYRLLFGSLAKKMELEHSHSATSRIGLGQSHKPLPRTGTARTAEQRAKLVKDALEASERVLKAVDAAQSYDLGGLRMVEKAKSRSKSRLRRKSQQKGSGLASAPASAPSTSREASAGLEGGSAESVSAEGTAESADFGVAGTNTRQAAMEGVGIDAAYKRHRSRLGASSGDKQAKGKGKGKDKVSAIGEVTAAQVDEAEADESSQVPPSPGAKAQGTPRKEKGGRVKSWGKERRSWRSSVTG